MKPLLYLVHRLPFPPNKGDKIRSFNLLKILSKHFKVFLGAFVDDEKDWKYQDEVNNYCEGMKLLPLNPKKAKLRSLSGFVTGKALSLPYYKDVKMQIWVNEIVSSMKIKNIMVFSSSMAQYVDSESYDGCVRIADFVDMDSDKWRQYSCKKPFPMDRLYAREAKRLTAYERKICDSFQKTLFVSSDEMQHFAIQNPGRETKLGFYKNGVNSVYFDPALELHNPYPESVLPIVFTGAMDYWANVDAVSWFVNSILKRIREVIPEVTFYIVGSNPCDEVLQLQKNDGVIVTGTVKDVRPYLKHALLVVAPLRIARGIQNKVLEGMAMAKPVVATPEALEGIEESEDYNPLVGHDEYEFSNHCLRILQSHDRNNPVNEARNSILKHYNWESNLASVIGLFDEK
jgi:sugar transferase (PEP-CTERM/EpsH1 system associated)